MSPPQPPPRAGKHELRTLNLLNRAFVLDVVALQAGRFRKVYGTEATAVWLAKKLKGAVVQELIALGLPPVAAVLEPIELGTIAIQFAQLPPILFGDLDPGLYCIVSGNTGQEIAL